MNRVSIVRAFVVSLFVWGLGPGVARAIPVFANGQGGVSCQLCHTAVPQLNRYGRYLLATNFSRGLNKHLQMLGNRRDPIAVELTANASHPSLPMLPSVTSDVDQFLSAGFLGSSVSYFASMPVVSGGFPSKSVDQVWVAFNGFSHDTGSLQIGRFATPMFAPWMSQSLSLSGYGIASLPVGMNASTISDNRWGLSYTQLGHLGTVANVSYLRGAGEGAAWTGSWQYISPESRFSGGVAAMSGYYPLPSGARDRYERATALVAYNGNRYSLMGMGMLGRDANPNDAIGGTAASRGVSFESIYGPRPWLHVDFRYEHLNDGLGTQTENYISDVAFSLQPNIVLTLENYASAGASSTMKYQLLWAGPWYRNRFVAEPPATPVSQDAEAYANGRMIYYTGVDRDGVRIQSADRSRYYQSCGVCHGTRGLGRVVLQDGAVSAKLGPNAEMRDSMRTMATATSMPGMTMTVTATPWTLDLFERAISKGLDQDGNALSPVMPRWDLSARDLHDIALYISTRLKP